MQKFSLKESKGVILPVLILLMNENRPLSVTFICDEIDSSDKTVCKALRFLQKKQAVTQVGRLFQFCGDEYQLPLYWGEQIEAANPTPTLGQASLPGMETGAENFSRKNSGLEILPPTVKTGKIPESGKISELEKRVAVLENRVSELENRKNSGFDSGKNPILDGNFPLNGDFSHDEFNSSPSLNIDKSINSNDDEAADSGKIPDPEEYRKNFMECYEMYRRRSNEWEFGSDALSGVPEYSDIELDELIKIGANYDLVDFVLPRAGDFETAKKWLRMNMREAKYQLCRLLGISGKNQRDFADREDVKIWEIDWHYWNWRLKEKDNAKITLGTVIYRIGNHFNRMSAADSWPLMCGYLE